MMSFDLSCDHLKVPHYHHDQIVFEVLPAELVFSVVNDTVQLKVRHGNHVDAWIV